LKARLEHADDAKLTRAGRGAARLRKCQTEGGQRRDQPHAVANFDAEVLGERFPDDDSGQRVHRLLRLPLGEAGFPLGVIRQRELVVIETPEHRLDVARFGHLPDVGPTRSPFGLSLRLAPFRFLFPKRLPPSWLLINPGTFPCLTHFTF
jgi:hypothetical protein